MNKSEEEIIGRWAGDISVPFISIRCVTYNHVNFIQETLDGFLMQETTYPFEIVIHDDASTDGTKEIIQEYAKKYPNIVVPMFEDHNMYSIGEMGAFVSKINEKMRGKYVALCEGDDYWTSPHKLQKQAEFMEANPDYSLCFHPVQYVTDGKVVRNDRHYREDCDVPTWNIIAYGGMYCATCSLVCRREDFLDWPRYREMSDVGDYPLQINLATKGKVRYISEIMGVYRAEVQGSWTNRNNHSADKMKQHFHIEREWMRELDRHTKGAYSDAIAYHLVDFMGHANRQITEEKTFSRNEVYNEYKQIQDPKIRRMIRKNTIIADIKSFVKKKVPYMTRLYKQWKYSKRG